MLLVATRLLNLVVRYDIPRECMSRDALREAAEVGKPRGIQGVPWVVVSGTVPTFPQQPRRSNT